MTHMVRARLGYAWEVDGNFMVSLLRHSRTQFTVNVTVFDIALGVSSGSLNVCTESWAIVGDANSASGITAVSWVLLI
jgi:hypothetical protein